MRLSRVNFHHRSRSLHLRTHALEAYGLRMFLTQVGNECDILMGERSLRSRSPQLPSQAPSLRGPPRRTEIRRILKIRLPYRRPASPFTQPQLASIDRITVVDVFVRDSPDESQTGINVRVFPALLQDRPEVPTATSTSGNPKLGRGSDLAIFPGIWT